MRVVFDAFWWTSGPTSLRHVLRETVFAWTRVAPEDDVVLVMRSRDRSRTHDLPPGVRIHFSAAWPQALLAFSAVERTRSRLGYDAIITQNFAGPSKGLSAVYLHDVLYITNPEWFSPIERLYFKGMPLLVHFADVVFTSSQSEAYRIRSNTQANRVCPVGLGMSRELATSPILEKVEGLRPQGFLLTVGRLNERKNLRRTILGALESAALKPDFPLVVVGEGSSSSLTNDSAVRMAVESGLVQLRGHVDDAALRWLYTNTALFLFLSLGEGFGMPPVEARYFGAAVLASDLPVMRENLKDEALFVDPLNIAAIGNAVRASLRAGTQRESSVGIIHDWDDTALAMRNVLLDSLF